MIVIGCQICTIIHAILCTDPNASGPKNIKTLNFRKEILLSRDEIQKVIKIKQDSRVKIQNKIVQTLTKSRNNLFSFIFHKIEPLKNAQEYFISIFKHQTIITVSRLYHTTDQKVQKIAFNINQLFYRKIYLAFEYLFRKTIDKFAHLFLFENEQTKQLFFHKRIIKNELLQRDQINDILADYFSAIFFEISNIRKLLIINSTYFDKNRSLDQVLSEDKLHFRARKVSYANYLKSFLNILDLLEKEVKQQCITASQEIFSKLTKQRIEIYGQIEKLIE